MAKAIPIFQTHDYMSQNIGCFIVYLALKCIPIYQVLINDHLIVLLFINTGN